MPYSAVQLIALQCTNSAVQVSVVQCITVHKTVHNIGVHVSALQCITVRSTVWYSVQYCTFTYGVMQVNPSIITRHLLRFLWFIKIHWFISIALHIANYITRHQFKSGKNTSIYKTSRESRKAALRISSVVEESSCFY